MSIITVSGQMGAMRDELALAISERGHMECVDRHTLADSVEGWVELTRDEHQLLAEQGPAMLGMSDRRRRVFAALLESVMLQYAQKGRVVLVGRGANQMLRMVPGVLRTRTVAPLELRAMRLAADEGLELDTARQLATAVDQQRRAYVSHLLGGDWSSPLGYDLVLNMGRLSLDQAATTVLDLAAHEDFQPGSETERLLADLVLASKVRLALVQAVDVHALDVLADAGEVTLEGYLAVADELDAAVVAAEAVDGVDRVHSNLEVSSTLSKLLY